MQPITHKARPTCSCPAVQSQRQSGNMRPGAVSSSMHFIHVIIDAFFHSLFYSSVHSPVPGAALPWREAGGLSMYTYIRKYIHTHTYTHIHTHSLSGAVGRGVHDRRSPALPPPPAWPVHPSIHPSINQSREAQLKLCFLSGV